jgi:hypothetical protein
MLYDFIESLPSDSVVIIDYGCNAVMWPENGISTLAIMKHLFSKTDIKIVMFAGWLVEGPVIWNTRIKPEVQRYLDLRTYGEDWVDFGYIPGAEVALAGMATDFHATIPKDVHGTPVGEIAMMQNIRTATDFALGIAMNAQIGWLNQWQVPYGTPISVICQGMLAPGNMPYLETGQLTGFVAGSTGAAQYEILIRSPGEGAAQADAISLSHVLVIAVIIIVNVDHFLSRSRGEKN